jgi:hypothetical protein
MDGALAGAWVILSIALFFIFFAKKTCLSSFRAQLVEGRACNLKDSLIAIRS